jgi:hypothetical protein
LCSREFEVVEKKRAKANINVEKAFMDLAQAILNKVRIKYS